MAKLGDLVRTILPLARPVGGMNLEPARAEREVTWVRVLKPRVPAFDAPGAAATAAGLTVLRVARADPIALERSVIGFLVNRRAELDRRAADLERQLARLALLGRGLDVLAAAIGSFLGRAVLIEGTKGVAAWARSHGHLLCTIHNVAGGTDTEPQPRPMVGCSPTAECRAARASCTRGGGSIA